MQILSPLTLGVSEVSRPTQVALPLRCEIQGRSEIEDCERKNKYRT